MRVFFYLGKSTSLYVLNLILNYRMFVVIWLFLARREAYKFVAPCIAWIAQRRRNSSWQYFYISLGFPHPVWRQGAFSTWLQILWCTIMFCSWKADVFIHRLSNNVYYRWIAIGFSDNWKRTASTRQRSIEQVAGNPRCMGKIYHRNSDAAITATWNPARATKKTSSYIERPLNPRVNKHGNKAKWLWNTRLS